MKDDPSISGKKTVEESIVESSWMWVDGVFQDGLFTINLLFTKVNYRVFSKVLKLFYFSKFAMRHKFFCGYFADELLHQ